MKADLVFGWRTAVLSLAVGQMVILAAALARESVNRVANRCLAALLIVLVGLLTPDMIGFAGFYDAFPWLSFAPFAIPLAAGPLLYFYVHALTNGRLPQYPFWHLMPAIAQLAYLAASFCLPLAIKNRWDDLSSPVVSPIIAVSVIVGLGCYCGASLTLLRRYRAALVNARSDDELYAARWLSRTAAAMLALLAAWTAYEGYGLLVAPLGYFGAFGLYLIIAALGCYLGVEGWRAADRRFPTIASMALTPSADKPARDWGAVMAGYSEQVHRAGWHADPELSLASLARLLGTNSSYLSRAINIGLGINFSGFVADLRCEAVAAALRAGSATDLLTLALDAGFGSKASFNRAFQAKFGESPSSYRKRHASIQE